MIDFDAIKNKLYNQARDLEVAIFNYHFMGDSNENAIISLSLFQNEDGGFHGVEPDLTNPNSSPFQTSVALEVLTDLGVNASNLDEFSSPMVEEALKYLDQTLLNDRWPITIESNNDFPCAVWWKHPKETTPYNPTASILASILILTPKKRALYNKAFNIANNLIEGFMNNPTSEKHDLICIAYLYQVMKDLGNYETFKDVLFKQIRNSITPVTMWEGYATTPIDYPLEPSNYGMDIDLVKASLDYLKKTFKGSYWDITWTWMNDDEGFDVQSFKWHGIVAIKNLRFIKAYERCCN